MKANLLKWIYTAVAVFGLLIFGAAAQTPTAPQVPSLPQTPSLPQVPSLPQAPTQPTAPTLPQSPTSPQAPTAPQLPSLPQTPTAPQPAIPPPFARYPLARYAPAPGAVTPTPGPATPRPRSFYQTNLATMDVQFGSNRIGAIPSLNDFDATAPTPVPIGRPQTIATRNHGRYQVLWLSYFAALIGAGIYFARKTWLDGDARPTSIANRSPRP